MRYLILTLTSVAAILASAPSSQAHASWIFVGLEDSGADDLGEIATEILDSIDDD